MASVLETFLILFGSNADDVKKALQMQTRRPRNSAGKLAAHQGRNIGRRFVFCQMAALTRWCYCRRPVFGRSHRAIFNGGLC